jgi:predicted nuclease with TOPRIM domain
MISLEQVKLLETRVARAIDYVEKITAENAALVSEKAGLLAKMEANQKRVNELEVLVMRFKDDQGRIEDGILAALDRLNQFEEAIEKSLREKTGEKESKKAVTSGKAPVKQAKPEQPVSAEVFFEIPEKEVEEDNDTLNEDSPAEGELDIF